MWKEEKVPEQWGEFTVSHVSHRYVSINSNNHSCGLIECHIYLYSYLCCSSAVCRATAALHNENILADANKDQQWWINIYKCKFYRGEGEKKVCPQQSLLFPVCTLKLVISVLCSDCRATWAGTRACCQSKHSGLQRRVSRLDCECSASVDMQK